jgi:predicted CXXCH cytochrome family protein
MTIKEKLSVILSEDLWLNKFIIIFLPFIVTFILPASSFSQVISQRQADSAKRCAICHYNWVHAFFEEHRDGELAPFPEESMVKKKELCFSCHDGSIKDDRERVYNDPGHRVNITPSEKITVPEELPLDKEGKMRCFTCHTHHAVSRDTGMEEVWIYLRDSNENSSLCKMCHSEEQGGAEKGNHSIDVIPEKIPQKLIDNKGRLGTNNQIICETCHKAHGGANDKFLVLPIEDPTSRSVLCEACHTKLPSLEKNEGLHHYSHPVDLKPVTSQLPSRWSNGNPVVKGTRGEIVCRTCHSPHNAVEKKFLLTEPNHKDSLCLKCHISQQSIKGTKHDLALIAPETKNVLGEDVSQSGPCGSCHLTHQGTGPLMWARKQQDQEEPMVDLCKSCHLSGRCAEEVPVPDYSHPPGTGLKDSPVPEGYPLYTAGGTRVSKGKVYCSSCHNTHQWDPSNPELKGSKDEEGDRTNSFLRNVNTSSTLCLDCHSEKKTIANTSHDLIHMEIQERNTAGELPAESGICGTCHLAHGSIDTFLWGKEVQEAGKPLPVQVCTVCHIAGGCAEKKQTTGYIHPMDVSLSSPRQPTLPFFTSKGTQDPKGLVFCSSCHDPHQWSPDDSENRGKKGEDGTTANSFLKIASNGNSPLCLDCHTEHILMQDTDHDLRVTAPEEKNVMGQLVEESGICGSCHIPHNATTDAFIWAKEPGPSLVRDWKADFTTPDNVMIGLCTSCHRDGRCAQEQVPDYGLHPKGLYVAKLQEEESEVIDQLHYEQFKHEYPIYTEEGERSFSGNIVCSTCHETHIWDPFQPEKGTGENREGDVTNSFLRKDLYFNFCSTCHSLDAIYQYKFFHVIKGRVKEQKIIDLGEITP